MSTFLDWAMALHEKGYEIIPIKPGSKRAVEDGWQKLKATEQKIKGWARNGYAKGNVGILCEKTPAVDIDVYDDEVAAEMEAWMIREFGDVLVRVGQAPKRLIMFRSDKPFKKMSCEYANGTQKHKIEILAQGQQFVAYGIHPDTQRPYTWTSLDEPMFIDHAKLPVLTDVDVGLIFDRFEALAKARGWKRVNRSGEMRTSGDDDDALATSKRPLVMDLEEIKETLASIPNDDADYDRYLDVGFALHHQFGGDGDGLALWHEWASQSNKYDGGDLDRRWESMGHGPATKTFATLKMWAKEAQKHERAAQWSRVINRINLAPDTDVIYGEVIPALAKMGLEETEIDQALQTVQARIKELTNTKPRLASLTKRFIAAKPKRTLVRSNMPGWVRDWVYVLRSNLFYNLTSGLLINPKAFDSKYGRELLTDEDRATGNAFAGKASDHALNLHEIKTVFDTVYMPGEGELLDVAGREFVNTFSINSVPAERHPTTPDDFEAIKRVERHFEILFPDRTERTLLLDYLAYTVQYPASKVKWAVLIQGVDGAGKSWISELMASVLGTDNVRSVSGESLREKYTQWAQGKKMVFIEEVRIHGANKYEIIDKLKPYMTNRSVPIRAMQKDLYEVPNVTNYLLFTNHDDALPLDRNDRRYLILRTAFLTKTHIDRFNADNPSYFADLFEVLNWHADVLRDWFLKRQLSDIFEPDGHAPDTTAKSMMRENADSNIDDMERLEELLKEGDPQISDKVLNATALREQGHFYMPPRTFGAFLKRAGFAQIGKFRLDGKNNCTYYTRDSGLFSDVRPDDVINVLRTLTQPAAIGFDDGFGDES